MTHDARGAKSGPDNPRDTSQGYTAKPRTIELVCGYGDTAADALAKIVKELRANHPEDALLSAVTVFYTDGHYEAEVAVRNEGPA